MLHKQNDILHNSSDVEQKQRTEVNRGGGELDASIRITIQESLTIIQSHIQRIQRILNGHEEQGYPESDIIISQKEKLDKTLAHDGKVIEGVFDGQMMIGPDGKKYQVPPNYASKSKLVEGDILKLTITDNGSFIYKQIGPIDRDRIVGVLVRDVSTGDFRVKTDTKMYKALTASVTYFKGEEGDEVTILIPKNSESNWAALENIIGKAH